MGISIRKISLIGVAILTAVFGGMNFQYSLKTRLVMTLVFTVVNIFSFLYADAHWARLRQDRFTQIQYFVLFVLMEIVLWVFSALAPTTLTGILSWLWIGAISICCFGILMLIDISYEAYFRNPFRK